MQQRTFKIAWALAALCVLAVCADSASAQGGRRGGGRGFGGFGFGGRSYHQIELATLSEVQENLKLTDDQKTKVSELNDEFREERRNQGFGGRGGGGGGGNFEEMMAARAKMNADFAAKLNDALEEPQQKRIQEIYVQVNGTNTLTEEPMAMALKLSDDQKEDLQVALDDQRQAMRDAFQDFQDMSDEERTAELAKLNKERDEALLAVLTDEQKSQFETMKGEKLEIDLEPLQQRGFGGGRGGFGGGRRGGQGGDGGGRPAADGN
jgi:Spy/CpxP family protein refolding chaperone